MGLLLERMTCTTTTMSHMSSIYDDYVDLEISVTVLFFIGQTRMTLNSPQPVLCCSLVPGAAAAYISSDISSITEAGSNTV
jgi:hypothetical protein